MKIMLTDRFQKGVRSLGEKQRSRCFDLLLRLPRLMGRPHQHAGAGLRKLHRSGIYEARLGLEKRLLFTYRDGELTLVLVGTHDEVRGFLASL